MGKSERRRAPKRAKHVEEAEAEPMMEDDEVPSWVQPHDANTPFGLVAPPLQSYFKEVNGQLTELIQTHDANARSEEKDMLLQAALSEMDGNELALATDPTCSLVLENMAPLLSEKALRTESKATTSKDGILRSLPEMVTSMFEEMESSFLSMASDPFASHILQSLVTLLAGVPLASLDDLRSKRSAKYRSKERQKAMVDDSAWSSLSERMSVPTDFLSLLYRLYQHMASELTPEKIHALMPEATSAPSLGLLMRLENGFADAKRGSMAWRKDSITSRVLEYSSKSDHTRSDFMEASLRDTVATHVLETALRTTSVPILLWFWKTYIQGRVVKLGAHPCANFVVATMLRMLPADHGTDPSPFEQALQELSQAGDQLVKGQMLGALQAALERSIQLQDYAKEVMHAITSAFRFPAESEEETRKKFVPVVLSMHTLKAYTNTQKAEPTKQSKRKRGEADQFTTQGSILLQRIAMLPSPENEWLYESLAHGDLATWCTSSTAVHVVIAALASRTASFAQRRSLLRILLPMLVDLCDDVWGSRVADAVWLSADGFTKNKIAQQTIQNEKRLLASAYGRFFVRRLRLGVYRKSPDEWKEWAQTENSLPLPEWKDAGANPFLFLRDIKVMSKSRTEDKADTELAQIFSAIE
ncbi:90S preribosome protein [Malassezia pachydermatis]